MLNVLKWVPIIVAVCACTKMGGGSVTPQAPLATPYTLPSEAYLGLANRQVGEEKEALLIMAAGRAIYEGRWQAGLDLLADVQSRSPIVLAEKKILLAKVASTRGHFSEAVAELSSAQDVRSLPFFYQIQYHGILADAYQGMGRLAESVGERMVLGAMLPSAAERAHNNRVIWLTLNHLPEAEIRTLLVEGGQSREMQGWLRLVLIAKTPNLSSQELLDRLHAWQHEFSGHPAFSILPPSMDALTLYPTPRHIALLLPMTGPLAGPGTAVRDGFMAAYQQADGAQKASVSVYDTQSASIEALYEQALSAGADFIIGPLSKPDTLKVAALSHPVPVVLLNEVPMKPMPHVVWFGLSPVSEAKQVALKASQRGYRHALVIAPAGPWGNEVLAGFDTVWRQQGGQVVEALRYEQATELTPAIRSLLQVNEQTGSRRQDIDMVFLLGYPSAARAIVPLLRYNYAGNLPIYATSAIYAGSPDSKLDRDIEGVIFCDMPFIFKQEMPNKHWPEPLNSYSRLYALGMDSYALTYQLNALTLFHAMGVDDQSGTLYLNQENQLVRLMAFGQFQQGRPVLLTDA